jgi:hypothetical protein
MTGTNAINFYIELLDTVLFPLLNEVTYYYTKAHEYLIIRGENKFLADGDEIKHYLLLRQLYLSANYRVSAAKYFYYTKRPRLIVVSDENMELPEDEMELFQTEFFKHHLELNKIRERLVPYSRILSHVYSNSSSLPVF